MSSVKQHFLDLFFYPESVAVVGASRNVNTFNFNLVANLINLKFPGKIYPVNPNAEEISGLKTYPDLKSIEGDIDLVIVAVAASKTPDIIRDCVAKGVKGVAIVSGGFSEIGEEGKRAQDEMFSLLRESGIRAIGPNALSPINASNNLVISFHGIQKLPKGNTSFIFQSGLYEPRLNWLLSDFNLYLNKLIDLSNKMDINELDALEYLAQDPETKVIAIHMESIAGDARAFIRLLKRTSKEKPVIVFKTGRTAAGAKAALSHTGAVAKSSDAIFDVAIKQTGAIRAQSLDEFFDLAKIFEYLPSPRKNRIAVSTLPGGEGVIAADICELNGFTMAQLSPETHSRLRSIFPPWDIPVNPFDMGVSVQFNNIVDVHTVLLDALADDSNVDCLAVQIVTVLTEYVLDLDWVGRLFCDVIKKGKPVVIWAADMSGRSTRIIQQLELNRIPVYPSAERAIKALFALYRYHNTRQELIKY